jgi:hypothetical protein
MKFFLIISGFILILSEFVNAQYINEFDIDKDIKIAIVPHILIFNGIRVDFEKKIAANKSVVFAPQIYLRERKEEDESKINNENYFKTLYGAGFDIYQKHFLKSEMFTNCYFAYGLSYNYFYINFHEKTWVEYIENNLQVIHYDIVEINEQIHRGGTNFIIGIDSDINKTFYFDIYIGLGLKYSYSIVKDNYISKKFDNFMTNYAYTGTVFTSGLKIGLKI